MTIDLEKAFATYFEEIERCEKGKCYWALLHLLVVLPDICAALESENGKADDARYRGWCKRYFGRDNQFTSEDRYFLRCALLHQGRTVTERGQYSGYSFSQPTPIGTVPHRVADRFAPEQKPIFRLDVGRMTVETVEAIHTWFTDLQKKGNEGRLNNFKRHIPWLAQKGETTVPGNIVPTVQTTSSTGGFSS